MRHLTEIKTQITGIEALRLAYQVMRIFAARSGAGRMGGWKTAKVDLAARMNGEMLSAKHKGVMRPHTEMKVAMAGSFDGETEMFPGRLGVVARLRNLLFMRPQVLDATRVSRGP